MLRLDDTTLVDKTRIGDRDAFAEIVRRYQNLVCSIAYAATGSYSSCEEIAQEAFFRAWTSIDDLRDAGRLRQWLCGIARNLSRNHARSAHRDLLQSATDVLEFDAPDKMAKSPESDSMSREEIDLVNRVLSSLPETYREPLILFYREEQSVARVAEKLDLSVDAVKQRLKRGRELLRDEVTAVVERGLLKTAPGRAFTFGVMASLPVMTGTAKAATVSVGPISAAKGATTAMIFTKMMGIASIMVGPLLGIAGGYLGYKMSMAGAKSENERVFIRQTSVFVLGLIFVFLLAIGSVIYMAQTLIAWQPWSLAIVVTGLGLTYVIGLVNLIFWTNRRFRQIRAEDRAAGRTQEAVGHRLIHSMQSRRIYESKIKLFGVPLVSVRFNGPANSGEFRIEPAFGWIAVGEKAYGLLFASGPIAIAPIACGAIAVGGVALGGGAVGGLAFGGAGIGILCFGGFGFGWMTVGGIAMGWYAAMGGFAAAGRYAVGGMAAANHANDDVARNFIDNTLFFQVAQEGLMEWFGVIVCAMAIAPGLIAMRCVSPEAASSGTDETSEGTS